MKDLEWLKEEVEKIKVETSREWSGYDVISRWKTLRLIDQVEQPELTTDQAWEVIAGEYGEATLDNNIDYMQRMGYAVVEKPEIPDYVAEYIQNEQEAGMTLRGTLVNLAKSEYQTIDIVSKTAHYADEKIGGFIDAYRYGYTVEEKVYEVRLPKSKNGGYSLLDIEGKICRDQYPDTKYRMTEKEINNIDPRYMAFAVPIDEVHE